jgi:CBS-domain-containing membrane protein
MDSGCSSNGCPSAFESFVHDEHKFRKLLRQIQEPNSSLIRIDNLLFIGVTNKVSIMDTAEKRSTFKVRKLAVTDNQGRLLGLITSIDLAKWLSAQKNYSDIALNALAKLGPVEKAPSLRIA